MTGTEVLQVHVGYDSNQDIANSYPSADVYANASAWANQDRFANSAELALYVLGPDGVLREFNFNEGELEAATDTEDRSDLSKDRQSQC